MTTALGIKGQLSQLNLAHSQGRFDWLRVKIGLSRNHLLTFDVESAARILELANSLEMSTFVSHFGLEWLRLHSPKVDDRDALRDLCSIYSQVLYSLSHEGGSLPPDVLRKIPTEVTESNRFRLNQATTLFHQEQFNQSLDILNDISLSSDATLLGKVTALRAWVSLEIGESEKSDFWNLVNCHANLSASDLSSQYNLRLARACGFLIFEKDPVRSLEALELVGSPFQFEQKLRRFLEANAPNSSEAPDPTQPGFSAVESKIIDAWFSRLVALAPTMKATQLTTGRSDSGHAKPIQIVWKGNRYFEIMSDGAKGILKGIKTGTVLSFIFGYIARQSSAGVTMRQLCTQVYGSPAVTQIYRRRLERLLNRLRKFLSLNQLGSLECVTGIYVLYLSPAISLQFDDKEQTDVQLNLATDSYSEWIVLNQQYAGRPFSSSEAAKILRLPIRTTIYRLTRGLEVGVYAKKGRGRSTRYTIVGSSNASFAESTLAQPSAAVDSVIS